MFKSIFFPNIKRNNYSTIKLDKIVVISIDENVDINKNINNFYQKRKQNSPYNNKNIDKEYLLEICDNV
jgi:hypothetical protein